MQLRRTTVLLPLLALTLVAGCTDDAQRSGSESGTSSRSASTPTSTPSDTLPVLQPGLPGEPNKTVRGTDVPPAKEPLHPADVRFMQHMIVHHKQALTMVNIVNGRLTDPQARAIAGRIKAEQAPESTYMKRWLRKNAQPEADPSASGHGGHSGHSTAGGSGQQMVGMATDAQLAQLRRTTGPATDKLFLTLMITHHGGALTMAHDRSKQGGTDPDVEKLGDDITSGQGSQIRHMRSMLARLNGAATPSSS